MTAGTYHLGIDLGTTYVAAGILRDGRPEIITLGDRAPVVPSVLYFKEDGEILSGESATRRGLGDPSRVVREFKRRVGDTTPLIVGQTPYSADVLLAKLLRFTHRSVVERQGGSPRSIAITHPANWGAYKIDVLRQAVRMAEVGPVTTLTEPVAAAIHYASTERLEAGQAVAVYDLGGGTFDAAVLRKLNGAAGGAPSSAPTAGFEAGAAGFDVLGDVEGIERLGGIDFDEAVFQHTIRWCDTAIGELDPDDPAVMQALARLRQECVEAKEALSTDTDVSIPVVLPNLQTEVRLTRAEFEAMIRPPLQQTVEALQRAVRSSGVDPSQLAAVLLVGGSSRTPLIAEMVGAELGRPIAVDQHPKHTVALGAAIAAARVAGDAVPEPAGPAVTERPAVSAVAAPGPEPVAPAATEGAGTPSAAVSQVIPLSVSSGPATEVAVPPANPPAAAPPAAPPAVAPPANPPAPAPAPTNRPSVPVPSAEPASAAFAQPRLGQSPTDRPLQPAPDSRAPVLGFDHRDLVSGRGRAPGHRSGSRAAVLAVLAIVLVAVVAGGVWAMTRDRSTTAAGETATEVDQGAIAGGEEAGDEPADDATGPSGSEGADVTSPEADGDAAADSTATTTATTSPSSTTATTSTISTTTESTLAGDAPLEVSISGVAIDGDRYAVSYSTNFEPLVSGDPASHHLHFFFDTVAIGDAGQPGSGPWILYDGPSPFQGYGPGDSPATATRMCVTVATHDHAVDDPAVFHCAPLPDG